MKSLFVFYDGDMISTFEGILFDCPHCPKFIRISEDMLLVALRKAITNVIRDNKMLLDIYYC